MISYYQITRALVGLDLSNVEECAAMHTIYKAQNHGYLTTIEIRAFEEILTNHGRGEHPLIQALWDAEQNGAVSVQKWADMTNEEAEELAGA